METAEQKALERYPEHWVRDIKFCCDIDENRIKRCAFIEGYEQALKDIKDNTEWR